VTTLRQLPFDMNKNSVEIKARAVKLLPVAISKGYPEKYRPEAFF
jgi:hypothetical protein